MASFHLWHPAYVKAEPLTLELFVTLGDALFPPRGGKPLADAALAALGLEADPRTARLAVARSHYFGSYRGSTGDWQSDWDVVWRLRMTLVSDRAPTLPDPPAAGYADLDGVPTTLDQPRHDSGWPCLLVADARDERTLENARAVLRERHPDVACEDGRAYGRYPQLRCVLGEYRRDWYEAGAAEAQATLAALTEAGASVRYSELLG